MTFSDFSNANLLGFRLFNSRSLWVPAQQTDVPTRRGDAAAAALVSAAATCGSRLRQIPAAWPHRRLSPSLHLCRAAAAASVSGRPDGCTRRYSTELVSVCALSCFFYLILRFLIFKCQNTPLTGQTPPVSSSVLFFCEYPFLCFEPISVG